MPLAQGNADYSLDRYNKVALGISLGGHCILFYVMLVGIGSGYGRIPENVIYSVSMEGSSKKGGMSQVPVKNDKAPIAPPKNVQKEKSVPKEVEPVKPEVEKTKEVKPVPVVEDAEVSLKEKETAKPTAKPTPKPKPKATPVEKKAEPPKAKPTPVKQQPVKEKPKATPKKDPVADANKNFEQALQRYLGESTNAGGTGFGGDGRGGAGMGGGVVKPPAWFLYKDQLEMSVKRGWNWHDSNQPLLATVAFRIAPDGAVSDVHMVRSSGNFHYDDSILRAVRKASPVPAPPAEFYDDFRFVEFDFAPR